MGKYSISSDEYPDLLNEKGSLQEVISAIGLKSGNLFHLQKEGIKIPLTFTITQSALVKYREEDERDIPRLMWREFILNIQKIEEKSGKRFGTTENPLLLSLRGDSNSDIHGGHTSILNIGINDIIARAIEKKTGNRKFAWESYARLIKSYGVVVIGISFLKFEEVLSEFMRVREMKTLSEFNASHWIEIVKLYKSIIMKKTGIPFPQDPMIQLKNAIIALFKDSKSERIYSFAKFFRCQNNFNYSIIVQEMVFGNYDDKSISGIVSSRDQITGSSQIGGKFAVGSLCLDLKETISSAKHISELKTINDSLYSTIEKLVKDVEGMFKGPQAIDFSYFNNDVYVLGVRPVQFSGTSRFAAMRDMANSGIISKEAALLSLTPEDLESLSGLLVEKEPKNVLANGVPAGACAIFGRLALSLDDMKKQKDRGNASILVKDHIHPEDLQLVINSSAVICKDDGVTSFAASLFRFIRKTAILEADFIVDNASKKVTFGDKVFTVGDSLTCNSNGKLFAKAQRLGPQKASPSSPSNDILQWADEIRKNKFTVLGACSTTEDVNNSKSLGADGSGFFPLDSFIVESRVEILNGYTETRKTKDFEEFQKSLINDVSEMMKSGVDTFCLFDKPIESYLPNIQTLSEQVAVLTAQKEAKEANDQTFKKEKDLKAKSRSLEIFKRLQVANPVNGVTGVRISILHPELLKLQLTALSQGASAANVSTIRVLLPNVVDAGEILAIKDAIKQHTSESSVEFKIGSIISSTRGCLVAGDIAAQSDFIIFNTSGLHQSVFAMTQEDARKSYLPNYLEWGILRSSPFNSVDDVGVGELMKLAANDAVDTKNGISLSVCGQQCSDAASIKFCSSLGLSSIICPPQLVPAAKLCAAQSVISSAMASA